MTQPKVCSYYVHIKIIEIAMKISMYTAEVRFAGFLSGGSIAAIVVNPPERKLEKGTSVL